jgi:23S rRNA pseudouridine955/2504/2580 synthase
MSKAADTVRQFTVGHDDDGIRLDRWFQRHLPEASFNTVSRWARTGQLRLDGARAKPDTRITGGQVIRVPPADPAKPATARAVKVRNPLSADQTEFAQSLVIHGDAGRQRHDRTCRWPARCVAV